MSRPSPIDRSKHTPSTACHSAHEPLLEWDVQSFLLLELHRAPFCRAPRQAYSEYATSSLAPLILCMTMLQPATSSNSGLAAIVDAGCPQCFFLPKYIYVYVVRRKGAAAHVPIHAASRTVSASDPCLSSPSTFCLSLPAYLDAAVTRWPRTLHDLPSWLNTRFATCFKMFNFTVCTHKL